MLDQLGGFGPDVRSLVLDHHERPDGGGYPRGLAGDELSLDARILAVCDVFDALVSERPYREAWPVERALATLAGGSGTQFDARCVQALTEVVRRRRRSAKPPESGRRRGARVSSFGPAGQGKAKGHHREALPVILRIDRLLTELPPPSTPDPNGAAAVQELLGGKFGEMSTFMNYTFQSFNFRNRQGARPFYDLVANIAAEEFGHVELVAATINTMLTGATPTALRRRRAPPRGATKAQNPQHFIAGGLGALLQDSMAKPWNGDNVFSSGDLVEDLTHNFFLETGARNNKLKVYEMVDHPAARALTGYLLVRGGVHQVAYARALEKLTGADLMKLFPSPRIPTDKIPECRPHIERGEHLKLYRFSPDDYMETSRSSPGASRDGGGAVVVDQPPEGAPANDSRRSRRCSRPTTRPRRSPRSRGSCAGGRPAEGAGERRRRQRLGAASASPRRRSRRRRRRPRAPDRVTRPARRMRRAGRFS